eukprot:366460-Chlamydomonas_euryale.AAC.2
MAWPDQLQPGQKPQDLIARLCGNTLVEGKQGRVFRPKQRSLDGIMSTCNKYVSCTVSAAAQQAARHMHSCMAGRSSTPGSKTMAHLHAFQQQLYNRQQFKGNAEWLAAAA